MPDRSVSNTRNSVKISVHVFGHIALLAVAPSLTGCQPENVPKRPAEAQPSAPPPPPPSARAPAPAAVDSAAPAPAGLAVQDAGLGDWIDASSYKFKVTNVAYCAAPELPRRATSDAAPPSVPEDRPLRVGVTVHVLAKYDELFVSPRDVTFEKGGIIINSENNPSPSAGCGPLLQPRTLRHDQVASGVVVFQLPDETFARTGIIAFQPTRWGGAPRAEFKGSKLLLPKSRAAKATN
jgi:hypothetical protein